MRDECLNWIAIAYVTWLFRHCVARPSVEQVKRIFARYRLAMQ